MISEKGIYRKGILRRFETWLLIVAVVLAIVFSCAACTNADAPMREPGPQAGNVLRAYPVNVGGREVDVAEFRDASGRACVLAAYNGRIALDCSMPALQRCPPLDYEDLPERPL